MKKIEYFLGEFSYVLKYKLFYVRLEHEITSCKNSQMSATHFKSPCQNKITPSYDHSVTYTKILISAWSVLFAANLLSWFKNQLLEIRNNLFAYTSFINLICDEN